MASVYKRQRIEPLPDGAKIVESVKAVPARASVDYIARVVTYRSGDGLKLAAPLTPDGKRIVSRVAQWTDKKGITHTAPVSDDGLSVFRLSDKYQCKYKDGSGRWVQESTGITDKNLAQAEANRREHESTRNGDDDPRAKQFGEQRKRPIASIATDYIASLATKGGTERHRDTTRRYIDEFITKGGWKTIADIDVDTVTRHCQDMKAGNYEPPKGRKAKPMSARAIHARLTAIKGFTKWLALDRMLYDPLASVKKPSPQRESDRRILLPDEWRRLRVATEQGSTDLGLSGPDRVTLYMLAIQTGLRIAEATSITRGNLVLSGPHPHVIVKAAGTKNKKLAKQYIDAELSGRLSGIIKQRSSTEPLFPVSDLTKMAKRLCRDLAQARSDWESEAKTTKEKNNRAKSDFLLEVNHAGEHLDFHALRHTCGAWLARAGVHPKVIQTVMRHSSITLTMDTYGHLFPGQDAEAVHKIAQVMRGEFSPTFDRQPPTE